MFKFFINMFTVGMLLSFGSGCVSFPRAQRLVVCINQTPNTLVMSVNAVPTIKIPPNGQWAIDVAKYSNFGDVVLTAQAINNKGQFLWTNTRQVSTGNSSNGYYYNNYNGYDGSSTDYWNIYGQNSSGGGNQPVCTPCPDISGLIPRF